MQKNNKNIYFFIGTEAELIKIFTVIKGLIIEGYNVKVISSGQNKISKSRVLEEANGGKIDLIINENEIKQTPFALITWFVQTYYLTHKKLKKEFKTVDKENCIFFVHGDTISTVMGARIAKKLKIKVAHIEGGLRSFDFFNPFPEELDRVLASRYTDLHFAPSKEAIKNLVKNNGVKISTEANTLIDSYIYSKKMPIVSDVFSQITKDDYFVFVLHRQENLFNEKLVKDMLNIITNTASNNLKCVFVMHRPTIAAIEKFGLIDKLNTNQNIIKMPRLDYFDFMKVLKKANFVLTDGGSNQGELYYLGTPCLLIRKKTEQPEGIGENIILSNCDLNIIEKFIANYKDYQRSSIEPKVSPTEIIIDTLNKEFEIKKLKSVAKR